VEVEQSRSLVNKKLDEMNDALDELRAQVISSDWEKAKASWKTAHLAFLGARPLTPQILINDLYGNLDAQLDERPKYGFQVMEGLIFSKTVKPSKDTALPIAARLVRDGRQARILMTKAELNALTVFRGLRNICGGMAEFLGEEGPNYLSGTSVTGSKAKLEALRETYSLFSPTTERLGPEVNIRLLEEMKNVDRLLVGTPDPHTVDLATKKMQKALDDVSDVLKVDPLLEGPELLQELGNLRVAVDGALVGLAANKPDDLAAQYSEFEVGWEGKVGRSVREVDDSDFQTIDTLRRSINEALYFGVKADTQRANQDLIDLAKALDRTIANVRKIPFTPGANK